MANDAASTANAGAGPATATKSPPSTGPATLPACTAAELTALPAAKCSGSSSDGVIENEAGMNRPSPAPSSAATGPSEASETTCLAASTTSTMTSPHRTTSATSMIVRAPILSVSIPPTGMRTVRGKP